MNDRGHDQCATCHGTGTVYPPAIFGEPVPDDAGEDCADCLANPGHDPDCRGCRDEAIYEDHFDHYGTPPRRAS